MERNVQVQLIHEKEQDWIDCAICIDIQKGSSRFNVKLHKTSCKHYANRKPDAPTMLWTDIIPSKSLAEEKCRWISRQFGVDWKYADCCWS